MTWQLGFLSKCTIALAIVALVILPVFMNGCKDEEGVIVPPTEHFDPEGLFLTAEGDTVVYYFQGVVRAGDTLKAPPGNNVSPHYTLKFLDADGHAMNPPTSDDHHLGWVIAHNNIAEVYRDEGDEWDFHIRGKEAGITTITLKILHGDHSDFTTTAIPLRVDPSFVGEAAGVQIIDEESGDTLAQAISSGITGSLTVQKDSTTDHRVLYFLDDEGIQFQPPTPPHGMLIEIIGAAIVEVIPEGPAEPWAFQLRGLSTGTSKLRFSLLHEGIAEFTSLDINVTVTP